jgi:hypothetical protein
VTASSTGTECTGTGTSSHARSSVVTGVVLAVVSSHTLLETLESATDVLGLTLESVVAFLTTA